jgi:hypothetical protein
MSRRTEKVMDELPELRSDADVDALMARLRARINPPPSRGTGATTGTAAPEGSDLAALHEGLASALVRAMTVMVDALEELAVEDAATAPRRTRRSTARRGKKS